MGRMPDSPLSLSLSNLSSSLSPLPGLLMLSNQYSELDSASELSALTEDEGDTDESGNKNAMSAQVAGKDDRHPAGIPKGSSASAALATAGRKIKPDVPLSDAAGASGSSKAASKNASSSRRKRNSIVPAPMWGWAEVKNAPGAHAAAGGSNGHHGNGSGNGSTSMSGSASASSGASGGNHTSSTHSGGAGSVVEEEEEEEEEIRGPPKAMEEEEEDDDAGMTGVGGSGANGSGHSVAGLLGDGEKTNSRRRARVSRSFHPKSTRQKGESASSNGTITGPGGEADPATSDADLLSASEEGVEESAPKRSGRRTHRSGGGASRKKDRTREDGDDDYVAEGNDSEPGSRKSKKAVRRSGAGSSSKRDPKTKDMSGAHDTHHGSDNDDEHRPTTRILRRPYRRDYRHMELGQCTDTDDDYVWSWKAPTSPPIGYPVLKRMRRMTTEEIARRDKRRTNGEWVTAKKRRPPRTDDAEPSSPLRLIDSPLSDIDYDLDSLSTDATAPSAREIGHIAVVAAASSIMAGSGTYAAPSSDSDASRSATPPRKGINHNTSPTAVHKSPLVSNRMPSHPLHVSTEQIRSPVTLQMTSGAPSVKLASSLHSLNTSPSSARRQAAEALGVLAQESSPTRKAGGSPVKSKPAAAPIVAEPMDADVSAGERQGSPIEENPANEGGVDEDEDQEQEAELVQEQEADQYQEPEPEQDNEQDAEPEQEQEQDPDQDQDRDQDQDQDQDQEKDEDLEVDLLESDLQPAHRAEALDVLASIELKFALLRERVYVEKMDGLAWEEQLVVEGSHPELLHLHKELTKRKAKRLELAFKKRDYEIVNAKKRRRVDEDAVWSWWMHARDELQTDMIAETNRKRRRLERERRSFERPQSVRRIPQQPFDIPLVPPSLRKILKSFPFGDDAQEGPNNKKRHSSSRQTSYPEVAPLSTIDVASDVDLIFQQRRQILNAALPPNQSQLTPGSQLTPTLYDVPAPLYGGHHILGQARPGPGVGIIGPGGMGLPPGVGVGMPVSLNHMGGIGGVGMVLPNAPLPGMGAPPHQHSHVPPPHGPPPHSAHQHQQQMQVHTHQHSHPRPHQHPHHSHPHQHQSTSLPPGPLPPGPPLPGYGEYPEGGLGIYGPGAGPGSGGRGMGGPPPPPPISQSASAPGYQQHVGMHNSHNVHPRDRDRNRDRERDRDREREREHPGDMSPFASSYGGSNGPTVTGGPPTAVASGGARPSIHGPPGYGRGHGYRDAEYEFEQQQQRERDRDRERERDRDRDRDRDREREQQRRGDAEPSSSQAQLSLPHHSQQQQTGAGVSMPPGPSGVMMIQPPYYGTPRDARDPGEMPGYPHNVSSETSGRREGREMLEGRDRDVKDPRDTRDAHDMRDGGRRSISPVNVGGPSNQSWMDPGIWYGGRNDGAMDVDDDERMVKERERRERERHERENDRDKERDADREYHQEMGKREYHVQPLSQHQHRHGPPLQHQHVHSMTSNQHNHHHSTGSHHHHHHHHVLHRHHGQRPTSTGPAGHGTSSSPPSSSGILHSPRPRDYDVAGRSHPGPGQLSTEAIQHANKPNVPTHWKSDQHLEHRERERDRDRERETQNKHGHGHPGLSPEERDRPLAIPFVMASSHAIAPAPSSGPSFSTGPSQGTHGGGGASPRSGWLRPEDLDRERVMGRERDIERERESDRVREKERDWERDREMEREGERERVREREREKDRERDSSYRMGAPPPASSVPPGFHGSLEGHRYAGPSGSGGPLLSRSAPLPPTPQQGSLPNPAAHSPPRSRQVPSIYPRSPTRYGPPPGSSHMSSVTPGSASPVSGNTTGPGQPPAPTRSPTVNTKIRPSSPLVHLVNKPLGGPSLPSSTTGSPKGAGGTAFSPPPLAGHGSPGVYSPRAGNIGSRPLSPRDSRKYGGSPTLPSISAVPGASTVTRSGPVFLEREREREREASPTPVTPASLSPIPPPNSGVNTSSSSSKMSVPQMLDGKE